MAALTGGFYRQKLLTSMTKYPQQTQIHRFTERKADGSTIAGSYRNPSSSFQPKQYEIPIFTDVRSLVFRSTGRIRRWYIDDAGIEIDVFKNAAHGYLNRYIHSNFGWGQRRLVNEPKEQRLLLTSLMQHLEYRWLPNLTPN